MEEFFGYLADRIGLDLRGRSTGRIMVIVALYTAAGLLLLFAGFHLLTASYDDAVSRLSGFICVGMGLAFLIRIGLNLRAVLRHPKA